MIAINMAQEQTWCEPASNTMGLFLCIQSRKKELFLLMTILSESFFAFVGRHLVAFSFLSAWHSVYILKFII